MHVSDISLLHDSSPLDENEHDSRGRLESIPVNQLLPTDSLPPGLADLRSRLLEIWGSGSTDADRAGFDGVLLSYPASESGALALLSSTPAEAYASRRPDEDEASAVGKSVDERSADLRRSYLDARADLVERTSAGTEGTPRSAPQSVRDGSSNTFLPGEDRLDGDGETRTGSP